MHKRLLIIGAGGFGREVLAWTRDVAADHSDWSAIALLDGNPAALDGFNVGAEIIGDPMTYIPVQTDRFLCAIGDPQTRLRLCRHIKERGGRFASLRHPTAIVGPSCRLGEGSILCPYSVVTVDATLGDFVTLNLHAIVGHDAIIGDGCTLNGHSEVLGYAKLGEGVLLGGHAVVLPDAQVGDYAKVGAGSVVLRRARARETVVGVPAKSLCPTTGPFEARDAAA